MSNAREAALSAIIKCTGKSASWSPQVLDSVIKNFALEDREAALCEHFTLGVLQNLTLIDYYIDNFCSNRKLENIVRNILRLGFFQILFCEKIPGHAAVNETVELCRLMKCSKACGFVNAVMRALVKAYSNGNMPVIEANSEAERLSILYSHPLWLANRLCRLYGADFTENFFRENNSASSNYLQVNTLKTSIADLTEALSSAGVSFEIPEFPDNCVKVLKGSFIQPSGLSEGYCYVQDAAARIITELSNACEGCSVLDACASPGGKSFSTAIKMNNNGCILSCDVSESKIRRIEDGATRLGIKIITSRVLDARCFESDYEKAFDSVIADVPCSGFGVVGKRPEIRLKNEQDINQLPVIQFDILQNVSRYVKPGGTLIYSTCTVLPEENENVVKRFLAEHSNFATDDFNIGDGIRSAEGMYTFWPHINGTDGFFCARLKRMT